MKVCEPYLSDEEANCQIIIDSESIEYARTSALNTYQSAGLTNTETSDWFMEVYVLLNKLLLVLPAYNMLFIHGSAIQYNGKAYVFVAPSGTGKSTHTRLWKEHFGESVVIINDDKPFITFRDGNVFICGTPWRGKHNLGQNIEAALGGICILSQGKDDFIWQVQPSEAVQDIVQQCNLGKYGINTLLALDLIDDLLRQVPVYRLSCTPTINSVDVCFDMIIK